MQRSCLVPLVAYNNSSVGTTFGKLSHEEQGKIVGKRGRRSPLEKR